MKSDIATQPDGTFTCMATGEGHKGHRIVVLRMGPAVAFNQNTRLQFTLADAKVIHETMGQMIQVLENWETSGQ